MRLSKLLTPDLLRALEDQPGQVQEALSELHAEDVAEVLAEDVPQEQMLRLIDALPLDVAADVLGRLPEELRMRIMEHLGPTGLAGVLAEMAPDDRADLVQDLPEELREQVLQRMAEREPDVANDTRALASYGEETAGGLMTTEYLSLGPELSVSDAIDEVRQLTRQQDPETIYYIYVVAHGKLIGVLSLRDLILGEGDKPIHEVMTQNVVHVSPGIDQEEVARMIARYDFSAVPVVDDHGHMLGMVTVDDVVDVVIDEATEDAQKMGAVVPIEEGYFDTGFVEFMRSRVTWLVVLFFGELLTANVMSSHEAQMVAIVDLVIFVPLIISSGGNSGAQSSSLVIRALALGEMSPADWKRVFARELGMGLALGSCLGAIGFGRAMIGSGADPSAMATTVFFSIVAVVTLGTMVGSLMPLAIQKLGGDPAVSSTPLVASLVDVFGLIVYFSVARLIFSMVI